MWVTTKPGPVSEEKDLRHRTVVILVGGGRNDVSSPKQEPCPFVPLSRLDDRNGRGTTYLLSGVFSTSSGPGFSTSASTPVPSVGLCRDTTPRSLYFGVRLRL